MQQQRGAVRVGGTTNAPQSPCSTESLQGSPARCPSPLCSLQRACQFSGGDQRGVVRWKERVEEEKERERRHVSERVARENEGKGRKRDESGGGGDDTRNTMVKQRDDTPAPAACLVLFGMTPYGSLRTLTARAPRFFFFNLNCLPFAATNPAGGCEANR